MYINTQNHTVECMTHTQRRTVFLGNNIYWFKFAYLRFFFRIGYWISVKIVCACVCVLLIYRCGMRAFLTHTSRISRCLFSPFQFFKLVFVSTTVCVVVRILKLFLNQTIKIFLYLFNMFHYDGSADHAAANFCYFSSNFNAKQAIFMLISYDSEKYTCQ